MLHRNDFVSKIRSAELKLNWDKDQIKNFNDFLSSNLFEIWHFDSRGRIKFDQKNFLQIKVNYIFSLFNASFKELFSAGNSANLEHIRIILAFYWMLQWMAIQSAKKLHVYALTV